MSELKHYFQAINMFLSSIYEQAYSLIYIVFGLYLSLGIVGIVGIVVITVNALRSFYQRRKTQANQPTPPSATIIGVRIPADGAPAHLASLKTTADPQATDGFLFHVPDLRPYWKSSDAWRMRDIYRLELLQDTQIPLPRHMRQHQDLRSILHSRTPSSPQLLHLRQRYVVCHKYYTVPEQFSACVGPYYVLYSFAVDDLPRNLCLPPLIANFGNGSIYTGSDVCGYYGDVFIVKMAPQERDEHGWAIYEDMNSQFLDLLRTA